MPAVVFDGPAVEAVLEQAAAAAVVQGASLTVALLHRRDGFSTDPALVARTRRERQRRLVSLLAELQQTARSAPVGVLVSYGWRPRRARDRMVARLVAAAAQRCDARLGVVAADPARTVSRLPVPVVVVDPSPVRFASEV